MAKAQCAFGFSFRNVVEAVKRINTDLGIGMRHITISTVGLAPKILKLAEALPQACYPLVCYWRHEDAE
jgi:adenine C2-methylase RlmN of 23S rRNA A2503 and tRNA A37